MEKIRICIDAGHFGKYNQSPANKAYTEAEAMWKLHLLQKKHLEQYGFEVILTRSNQATDLSLTTRGRKAKGCHLFISNHSNAVVSGVNESVDYPVVYVPLNGSANAIGKDLADCIAKTMGTKQAGRIATRKGSGGGDYYGVIRGAVSVGVAGMILEHSFHTNSKMTAWLLDESNLDKLAQAETAVIAEYFGVKKLAGVNTSTSTKADSAASAGEIRVEAAQSFSVSYKKIFKVTASALNMRAGAGTNKAILTTLKKGASFRCYGYYTAVNGTVWLYGVAGGKTGFCSRSYLK